MAYIKLYARMMLTDPVGLPAPCRSQILTGKEGYSEKALVVLPRLVKY